MGKRRRFGMIRKLTSGRFQASYLDPRTNKRMVGPTTYKTRTAAEHWLIEVQAGLNRGELPDLSLGRTPFDTWATNWLRTRQVAPKTLAKYRSVVNGLLIPYFGKTRLVEITRNDVVELVSQLSTDQNENANEARRFAAMILEEAVRSNAIRINPADNVKVKRRAKKEMVFLTRQQVQDLSNTIATKVIGLRGGNTMTLDTEQYRLMVRLVSETGLRAGEVAALRVGRVDISNRRLHVVESVAEVNKDIDPSGLQYGPTKNYERRSIPLPARIVEELALHLATRPKRFDTLVFTSLKGEPIRHTNFYDRHYKPAVLNTKGVPDRTRFHDLRHTYAALLIAAGANPLTVKQRMGHSSITVTMDRYGHLFPHLEEEITERMDAAYRTTQDRDVARSLHEPENRQESEEAEGGGYPP